MSDTVSDTVTDETAVRRPEAKGTVAKEHDHHGSKPAYVNGIDPLDEPSVKFGWHGHSYRFRLVFGIIAIVFLLGMAFVGNHQGNIENWFCVGFALVIAVFLVADFFFRGTKAGNDRRRDKNLADMENSTGGAVDWARRGEKN